MPREIAVLTNPIAGRGRGNRIAGTVASRLRDAGFVVHDLRGRDADEARDLVRQCVAEDMEAVVVVGGDGMVHLAIQELACSGTRLGVVPAGSGNDVARYFDVPLSAPETAADVVIASRERRVDLVRVGSRYFLTVLAAGFDAIVNERANAMRWPRGQMRYHLATLAALRRLAPIPYVVEVDGEEHRFDATMVAVGNGPSFGGGLRIAEGAKIDDGLLDVVVIEPMGRAELVRTYPRLFDGSHVHHPKYRHHRGREATIAAPGIVAYADGERIGPLPLTMEVVPQALHVLVP